MPQGITLRIWPTSYTISQEGGETVIDMAITLDELEAITTQIEAMVAEHEPAESALPQITDDWLLPYCACGRRWSQCDGSRVGCHRR